MRSLRPSPQAAARELAQAPGGPQSIIDFARYIEVPGAPLDGDDSDEFARAETQLARHHESDTRRRATLHRQA
jgi:hypothetical protein